MKRLRLLLILLLGVNLLPSVQAQQSAESKRIRFEYLTVADGLPENTVTSMLQDHLGFMWLGTQNGLVRYDGTTMTSFPYSPKNPYSLNESYTPRALIEDRNGDIWIGGKNLFRYERSTGRFIEYPWQNAEKVTGVEMIYFLHQDQRGDIWAITMPSPNYNANSRLNRLRPSTGQWTYFRHDPHNIHSLASTNISLYAAVGTNVSFGFLDDRCGKIWVITSGEGGNRLHRFDPAIDQFQPITPKTSNARVAADFKTINLLTDDQAGNLYLSSVAAKGLFRFSPSRDNPQTGQLQQYVHQPANPASLRSDSVYQAHVARNGTVWVPTQQGLEQLDPRTGRFTHILSRPDDPASLLPGPMRFLAETPAGDLWFANQTLFKNDLVMYEHASRRFIRYVNTPGQPGALQIGKGISSFYVDKTALVWVGGWTGGLSKQIRQTYFPSLPLVPIQQPGLPPTVIYQAPSEPSVLWLGTAQGLTRQDRTTGQYTHYQYDSLNAHSIGKGPVVAITEDRKGRFWVATRPGGLHLMDRRQGRFRRFTHNPADANSLLSPLINALLATSDGNLWISTSIGLDRYDPDHQQFTHHYLSDTLYTPNLYTALDRLSRTNRQVAGINHPGNNVNQTLPFRLAQPTDVAAVVGGNWSQQGPSDYGWLENEKGQCIWETTYSESRSDGHSSPTNHYRNQVTVLRLPPGHYRLRYQSDGSHSYGNWPESFPYHPDLWGIQLLRLAANEVKPMAQLIRQTSVNGVTLPDVRILQEDIHQQIWIGLPASGLDRFDPVTKTVTNYTDYTNGPVAVTGLLTDNRTGDVWVGDYMRGLLHLNANGQLLRRYTAQDGLPTNAITSLLRDDRGNLWMGTHNGLAKLDAKTGQIRRFDRSNGLPALLIRNLAKTIDGSLYVTTEQGTVVVDPTRVEDDRQLPPVVLTDLAIHDKPATLGPNGQLPVHISIARELTLPYDQNSLTFHFAALQYSRGNECRYAYRLTPLDNDWVQTGTIRQARYTDIRPGQYTFSVKVANPDGYWNERGTSIRLTILPPWWQTWWAYGLYALLFMGGLWAYIRYRSRSLRRQNQFLEEKVTIRTDQVQQQKREIETQRDSLEQALTDLKTTQAQLIQKEKLASLGELTAGIAHEIQNPLNFVTNYSALSAKLLNQLTQIRQAVLSDERNGPSESHVLATLAKNLQKIGHHGERASAIVNGMLAHSRNDTGERRLTDLNALVNEYLRLAYHGQRVKVPGFNCQLVTEFDPNLDQVLIIPQQIGQVLLNLLTNAFYALQQQRGVAFDSLTVWVSTKQVGELVEIRIRDNGAGIAETVKDKIFQPFFTTKPPGEGTGLGLSLSYDIVTKGHGGTLIMESREGEGTTFTVGIPTKKSIPPFIHPR